jgi:hypothetical protein
MRHTSKFLVLLLVLTVTSIPVLSAGPLAAAPAASSSVIEVTFDASAYSLTPNADGKEIVNIDGYTQAGLPGEPLLPQRVFNVALPPGVDPASVAMDVIDWQQETVTGRHQLTLAVADMTSAGASAQPTDSGGPFALNQQPTETVSIVSSGELRKWQFVRIQFSPVLYWPDTGKVDIVTRITVQLSYDLPLGGQDTAALTDTVADDEAQDLLYNFDQAAPWYATLGAEDEVGGTYDYVIITTNAIRTNASNVTKFKYRKESMGYNVKIVTESDYDSPTGQAPNGTAEKIRQWLIDNYLSYGIEYVLLIGDPDPSTDDVPMKMCWPLRGSSYPESYWDSPTDYFYADLTGNWDKNGDGYFGVWGDDTGVGGVDYTAEVKVGRIPVYNSDYNTLDSILQKIMDYEDEVGPLSWRKSALLPMSFSTTTYDGAPLAEQMMDDYLTGASYGSYTMYQQGGGACGLNSSYTSDAELRGGAGVRDQWAANDYGLVLWWGHGWYTSASVGCDNCWDGTLFASSYTSPLDDDHPAIIYQNSCLNGYPEDTNNLQYALLKKGGIATVGASRVSWFNSSVGYGQFDGSTTNSGIGYEFAERIVAGQAAGAALYNAKGSMTPEYNTRLMNFYDFNLYGDPSVDMLSSRPAPPSHTRVSELSPTQVQISWQDNSTNETGFEVQRSLDGISGWEVFTNTAASVTSVDDTQNPSNVPYYRVAAYNDKGFYDYGQPVTLVQIFLPIVVRP